MPPNTPVQFPNFDLPGAEWLSLAPNANIAIQGRRRVIIAVPDFGQPPFPVQTGLAQFTITQNIEPVFPLTAGIYLHYMTLSFAPDTHYGGILIFNARMGFGSDAGYAPNGVSTIPFTSGDVAYDIGTPFAANLTPITSQPIIIERDVLILARDIAAMSDFNGFLNVGAEVSVSNNQADGPLGAKIYLKLVYTRLDGFTE